MQNRASNSNNPNNNNSNSPSRRQRNMSLENSIINPNPFNLSQNLNASQFQNRSTIISREDQDKIIIEHNEIKNEQEKLLRKNESQEKELNLELSSKIEQLEIANNKFFEECERHQNSKLDLSQKNIILSEANIRITNLEDSLKSATESLQSWKAKFEVAKQNQDIETSKNEEMLKSNKALEVSMEVKRQELLKQKDLQDNLVKQQDRQKDKVLVLESDLSIDQMTRSNYMNDLNFKFDLLNKLIKELNATRIDLEISKREAAQTLDVINETKQLLSKSVGIVDQLQVSANSFQTVKAEIHQEVKDSLQGVCTSIITGNEDVQAATKMSIEELKYSIDCTFKKLTSLTEFKQDEFDKLNTRIKDYKTERQFLQQVLRSFNALMNEPIGQFVIVSFLLAIGIAMYQMKVGQDCSFQN